MDKLTEKQIRKVLIDRCGDVDLKYSNLLWSKVFKIRTILGSSPFIDEVAVCNSLSFDLVTKDSDIDLFFVLNEKRFFMARFFISIVFELFGIRRKKNKIAARFCLSFFVDKYHLDFSAISMKNNYPDYYLLYWYKSLIFLNGNYEIQNQLIEVNKNFEAIDKFRNIKLYDKNFVAVFLEKVLLLDCFDFIENLLKKIMLQRSQNKNKKLGDPAGVIIKSGLLKFHVKDIRSEFNKEVYLRLFK